ncbi:hypothetical protein [Klebsiella pneumoniae]|uniref:hypothetical protein n=1 Tax=Klebsiella pneumoniae TaxID=573 RepID=UPI00388F5CAA
MLSSVPLSNKNRAYTNRYRFTPAHMATHMHIPHTVFDAIPQLLVLPRPDTPVRYFRHSFDPERRFVFKRAHQRRNADLIFDPRLEKASRRFTSLTEDRAAGLPPST